jgi:pimeloyl-ACP methyl ester carboxylesterase
MQRETTVLLQGRRVVGLLAGVILGGLVVFGQANVAKAWHSHNAGTKPTIVLVHGAWADSGSWNRVVKQLQQKGYPVRVPPNPLRGLAADSAYIADFIHPMKGPIVLVGHSYGGSVITDAAVGDKEVKALVYVDAFIPKEGQTVEELAHLAPGSCLGGEPTTVFEFIPFPGGPLGDADLYAKVEAEGTYPGFAECFANGLPAAKGAVLAATQRPLAANALVEPSGPPAWRSIPSWAFVGTVDRVIVPAAQLIMAHNANATVTEAKAPHLSMLSDPKDVTDVIVNAAEATS